MPPQGTRLTPGQVDTIRQWITQAALRREHWAFRPLVRPDCRSSTAAAPRRLATRPTRPCGCRTATRSSSTAMLAPTNRRLSRLRPTSGSSGPSKTSRCSATRDLAAGRYLLSWRPRDDASGRVRVADAFGWVAERLNAPVLKTGSRESGSWVQIPPHPLFDAHSVAERLPVARALGFLRAPDAPPIAPRRLLAGSPKRERGVYSTREKSGFKAGLRSHAKSGLERG